MKKIYTIVMLMLLLVSTVTFAQESANWVLGAETSGVKAYYQVTKCENESVVFLKFENSTNGYVQVEWDEYARFEEQEDEFKLAPVSMVLNLEPGSIQAENCTDLQILQLVSRPNLMYSIHHMENSVDTNTKVPSFAIAAYRIDNLIVSQE